MRALLSVESRQRVGIRKENHKYMTNIKLIALIAGATVLAVCQHYTAGISDHLRPSVIAAEFNAKKAAKSQQQKTYDGLSASTRIPA